MHPDPKKVKDIQMIPTQKSYHDRHAEDLPLLMVRPLTRIQDHTSRRWNQAIVNARCYEPRSYLVEAQNGHILRRSRRQIQETSLAFQTFLRVMLSTAGVKIIFIQSLDGHISRSRHSS